MGILELSWGPGASVDVLEASWKRLGVVLGRLGSVLGLGPSWAVFGAILGKVIMEFHLGGIHTHTCIRT